MLLGSGERPLSRGGSWLQGFVLFVANLASCSLTAPGPCVSASPQDCVQLNQYTLKDEIGKVSAPGAGTSRVLGGAR